MFLYLIKLKIINKENYLMDKNFNYNVLIFKYCKKKIL